MLKDVIKLYEAEFPAIKNISEEAARQIEELNRKNGKPLTIKEIFEIYKSLGKLVDDPDQDKESDKTQERTIQSSLIQQNIEMLNKEIMELEHQSSHRTFLGKISKKLSLYAETLSKKNQGSNPAEHTTNKVSDFKMVNEMDRLIRKLETYVKKVDRALSDLRAAEKTPGFRPMNLLKAKMKNIRFLLRTANSLSQVLQVYKKAIPQVKETMKEIQKAKKQVRDITNNNLQSATKKEFTALQTVIESLKKAQFLNMQQAAHQKCLTSSLPKEKAYEISR